MRFNLRAGQLSAIVTVVLEAIVIPVLTGIEDGVSRLHAKRILCNTGRVELKRSSRWQKLAGLGVRHRNWPHLLQQVVILSAVVAVGVFEQGLEEKTGRVLDTSSFQWVVDVQQNFYDNNTELWSASDIERREAKFIKFGHTYRKYLSLQGRTCMNQDEDALIISGPVIEEDVVVGCLGSRDFLSVNEVRDIRLPRVREVVVASHEDSSMVELMYYTFQNTFDNERLNRNPRAPDSLSIPRFYVNRPECFGQVMDERGVKIDVEGSACGGENNFTICPCEVAYTLCVTSGGDGEGLPETFSSENNARCISSLAKPRALVESYCRREGCNGRSGFEEGEGYESFLFRRIDRDPGLLVAAIEYAHGGMHANLGSIALALTMLSSPVARKGNYRLVDGRTLTVSPKLFLYFLIVPCVLLVTVSATGLYSKMSTKLIDKRPLLRRLKDRDILDDIYDGRNVASNLVSHYKQLERCNEPQSKIFVRLEPSGDQWNLWYECQGEEDEQWDPLPLRAEDDLGESGSSETNSAEQKKARGPVVRKNIRGQKPASS